MARLSRSPAEFCLARAACWAMIAVLALGILPVRARAAYDDLPTPEQPVSRLEIIGLMHSGTNLLENVIKANFYVSITKGLYSSWKHNILDRECLADMPVSSDTLVLSLARDAVTQLERMYGESYEYRYFEPDAFEVAGSTDGSPLSLYRRRRVQSYVSDDQTPDDFFRRQVRMCAMSAGGMAYGGRKAQCTPLWVLSRADAETHCFSRSQIMAHNFPYGGGAGAAANPGGKTQCLAPWGARIQHTPFLESCHPSVMALRTAFLQGEMALAASAPRRLLRLRYEPLFGTRARTTDLEALLITLATTYRLPRRNPHVWDLSALDSYAGFNSKYKDAPPKWQTWAELARRHPAAFARVCMQLDRGVEAGRGYGESMAELAALCSTPEQLQLQRDLEHSLPPTAPTAAPTPAPQQVQQQPPRNKLDGPPAAVSPWQQRGDSAPDPRYDVRANAAMRWRAAEQQRQPGRYYHVV